MSLSFKDVMCVLMTCCKLCYIVDRNALNIVKDDLIATVDELTGSVVFSSI